MPSLAGTEEANTMGVSVRKKGNSWFTFTRVGDRRQARRFDSEEEARGVAAALRHAISLGEFDRVFRAKEQDKVREAKPMVPTLEEYYENIYKPRYLDSAVSASTASKHANSFKNQIKPALITTNPDTKETMLLGALRLDEVDHERMEEFVSNLVKKGLAKATIETVLNVLRALFNHARKRKIISENPATGLTQLYSQAKAKHEDIEPLKREEVPPISCRGP